MSHLHSKLRIKASIDLTLKVVILITAAVILSACSHTHKIPAQPTSFNDWQNEILNYQNSLPQDHPDSLNVMLSLSPQIKQLIDMQFGAIRDQLAINKLSRWLIDENGHNMSYDVTANLKPNDAFQQGVSNCLSYTILLVQLAEEIGIQLDFNMVDIPNNWGEDSEYGLFFYRHMNAVLQTKKADFVYDLAFNNFGQKIGLQTTKRIINKQQALAQLHSNRGMSELNSSQLDHALHLMKLAVSLDPSNSDLWLNLGVVFKKLQRRQDAERAFMTSLKTDRKNILAANHLERFYLENLNHDKAKQYANLAQKMRNSNPYYHFHLAKQAYAEHAYQDAKKSLDKAIRLHKHEPKFYELRSRSLQYMQRYRPAIRDLKMAAKLSESNDQILRYSDKIQRISRLSRAG